MTQATLIKTVTSTKNNSDSVNKNSNESNIISSANDVLSDVLTTPFGNIARHLNQQALNDANDNDSNISRPSTPLPIEVVRGLNSSQISTVLDCCVDFISYPVSDADCMHAILRLVLRLTRQHEYAVQFSNRKGPQYILNLTQKSSFIGYASLITLIFRHICEDENNLRLTMEKTIRLALTGNQHNIVGLQPGGMGAREFHNIMRVLGPAICRHSDLFLEVATDILRIVIKREDENMFNSGNTTTNNHSGYVLRAVQAKLMPATSLPEYAHDLVIDLLNFLIKPLPQAEVKTTCSLPPTDTSTKQKTSFDGNTSTSQSTNTSSNTKTPTLLTPLQQQQPLLLKSGILRILSELVRSYAGCAKIVTTHIYKAGQSEAITEDYNAIAFLLDNFLPSNQTFGDKDCPSLCRLLIVALASCNHCLDSQNALVHEVKLAFNRALNLAESPDKHLKVQSLATIINTMIETCPAIANNPNNNQNNSNLIRQQQQNMVNNMMKIMHKKGLINDLAHAPLYMDLSCSKCIESVNSILKPLETMSKTLNMTVRKREIPTGAKSTTISSNLPTAQTITTSIASQNIAASSVVDVQAPLQQEINTSASASAQVTVSSTVGSSTVTDALNAETNETRTEQEFHDAQMIDLNITEMEPQQALPQDVDMPSVPASSRNFDERVLDRVIEALNQENDSSDSEYEGENRIIRIQADNENDQIRIQIETTGEDEGDNSDDDENSDENLRISTMSYENEEAHDEDEESNSSSDSDETDDEDDEDVDGDGGEDEEDDEENPIDEELVEGSDGRSAVPSDISDEENEHNPSNAHRDANDPVSAIASAVANALESADAALSRDSSNSGRHRNRQNNEDDDEDDQDDDEDDHEDSDDEEGEDEEVNEDMELDEEDEEIIEDEDEDEDEEEEDEDEEAIDENEEDEHDDVSFNLGIINLY